MIIQIMYQKVIQFLIIKIIYEVDIQYSQDYMKDLVEAGLVSTNGSYKDIDYISLKDTIENQKSAGLTCKEK